MIMRARYIFQPHPLGLHEHENLEIPFNSIIDIMNVQCYVFKVK